MLGHRPNSALPISDIYTVPKGIVTQAVSGVQGTFGPIPTINGSAQIKIYEVNGVEGKCTLQMISDLFLENKHRHMYARTQDTLALNQGQAFTAVKGIVGVDSLLLGAVGHVGQVIAQGTFVFPTGMQATAVLGDGFEGDKFDYWKKIVPTGNANWEKIVIPKPTI